nr:DEAD/DEAH box helicase [Deltaproteobacteria bacterium]
MDPLAPFAPATRRWFADSFPAPTRVQALGWPLLAAGDHALLLAPTGSGKTLAAFLACLDRLARVPGDDEPEPGPGVRVVYISPLKALVADIERNLRAPLMGLANAASRLGEPSRAVTVAMRTGDTSARDRRLLTRDPADILVTTPESLYLMLGSNARESLRTVETVIVDEIHAVAATKRGVHLAVTLERLSQLANRDPQRIGLSATQRPLEEIARFLGGDRPVRIVDAGEAPRMDLEVIVPVADMENPTGPDEGAGNEGQRQEVGGKKKRRSGSVLAGGGGPAKKRLPGIWPSIYPELLALVRKQRSTIIFVNSRLSCERIAGRLNELAGEEIALAHHGSISHVQRTAIEERLKEGRIPAIVASSSLELGIDMGFVDLVVMVESPGSVARGLQRLGRAGHGVGQTSVGKMIPKFRGDLLESVVVASRMRTGDIERTRVPQNCLDVLAQQVVAAVSVDRWTVDDLLALIRRTWPYRDLTRPVFESVLDMLSGRYPSDDFRDLVPRITWDRTADSLVERRGARMLALLNAGTIPDRGLYTVQLGAEGPRLGELDEEMVFETRRGDRIILGASTWRVEEIKRDRVIVSPAPGEPGKLPFWHGDRPGRPIELGRAIGAVGRELVAMTDADARAQLEEWRVTGFAADNLLAYLGDQVAATEVLPSDTSIVVESFRDELGDWRICILTPYGSRVHAPWAMAIEAAMGARGDTQVLWTDDGIALRFADAETLPDLEMLIPDPDEVEERVLGQVRHSALFATRFRENAGRALLLPKRRPGSRSPLWAQRLKAQNLLAVVGQYPAFPLVLETWREILRDVFDLPALIEILREIRARTIRVHEVETASASPFARNLVFAWVAAYMYDQDTPVAERKAAALSLDRGLLRELLGGDELGSLLDAEILAAVEDELTSRAEERRARHPDGLHDLLRRLGDLSADELAERSTDSGAWIPGLERERRIVPVRIAGVERWIAV